MGKNPANDPSRTGRPTGVINVLLCELCGALFHPEDLDKFKKTAYNQPPECLFCKTELVPYS